VRVQCVSANGTCTSIELPIGATPEEREVLEAGRKAEDSAKNETVSQGSGRHIGTDLVVTPGTVQIGRGGYTPVEFKGLDGNAIRVASLENAVAANGNDPVYRTLGDVKTLQARNATLPRTGADPNAALAMSMS
jgi:hypothetical protein